MEEPIWMFFGVLAVVLSIGIIISILDINKGNANTELFDSSFEKLQIQCDFICASSIGNRQGINIQLLPNSLIYTNENKICLKFEDRISCKFCKCEIDDYELNLNTSFAKTFNKIDYKCYFEKVDSNEVEMECLG